MTPFGRVMARRRLRRRLRTGGAWTEVLLLDAARLWHREKGSAPRWRDWTPCRGGVTAPIWPTGRIATSRLKCSWSEYLRRAGLEPRPAHRPNKEG